MHHKQKNMKLGIMEQLKTEDGKRSLCVVFATVAIGIIVKIHVRHIIQIGFPRTIEGYYQEIGRSSR